MIFYKERKDITLGIFLSLFRDNSLPGFRPTTLESFSRAQMKKSSLSVLSPGKVNALPFSILWPLTYIAEDWHPWVLSFNERIIYCHGELQMMVQGNPFTTGLLSNHNSCKNWLEKL